MDLSTEDADIVSAPKMANFNFACKQCRAPLKLDGSFTDIQPHTLSDLMVPVIEPIEKDSEHDRYNDETIEAALAGKAMPELQEEEEKEEPKTQEEKIEYLMKRIEELEEKE